MKRTKIARKQRFYRARVSVLRTRSALRKLSQKARAEREADLKVRRELLTAGTMLCEKCGEYRFLEVHHVVSRRYKQLRWTKENLLMLCHDCHQWWHDNRKTAVAWFIEKFGLERWEDLQELRRSSRIVRRAGGLSD